MSAGSGEGAAQARRRRKAAAAGVCAHHLAQVHGLDRLELDQQSRRIYGWRAEHRREMRACDLKKKKIRAPSRLRLL